MNKIKKKQVFTTSFQTGKNDLMRILNPPAEESLLLLLLLRLPLRLTCSGKPDGDSLIVMKDPASSASLVYHGDASKQILQANRSPSPPTTGCSANVGLDPNRWTGIRSRS